MTIKKADRKTNRGERILVVDDDENLRELYSEVLTSAGYCVATAGDGEAGWKLLQSMRQVGPACHLLITDNDMPKLTGIELVQRLRSAGVTLPAILMSSTLLENCKGLDVAAMLAKCFPISLLLKTVEAVLSGAAEKNAVGGSQDR